MGTGIEARSITRVVRLLLGIMFSFEPAVADPAYTGSSACVECHPTQATAWRESDHFRSMQVANSDSVLGDFDDVRLTFHGRASRLYRKDSRYFIETRIGDETLTFPIAYTFGYFPLQQYLVPIEAGKFQALNIAWDSRTLEDGGQRWFHLQPVEADSSESPFFWTRHLQNWNSRCAECHSTNVKKNYNLAQGDYRTTFTDVNVGCEACHGPGATHSETTNEKTGNIGRPRAALDWKFIADEPIARAAEEAVRDEINVCGGCHSRRTTIGSGAVKYEDNYQLSLLQEPLYYPDGQIHDEVFVLGSFLQSRMYAKGVTCTNCHEPHTGKIKFTGNSLCNQCHLPSRFDSPTHHFHQADGPGAQCVNCHMPETTYMMVDARRDHRFGIPNPSQSVLRPDIPNACNQCHRNETPAWAADALSQWSAESVEPEVAQAMLTDSNPAAHSEWLKEIENPMTPAIRIATLLQRIHPNDARSEQAVSNQLPHNDPLVRFAAVRALSRAPADRRWHLLAPLVDDPARAVRFEVASALSDLAADVPPRHRSVFSSLMQEYRQSLALNQDTPSTQTTLGLLAWNSGQPVQAEQAFTQALAIEPVFVPALLNLADLYRAANRDAEGEPLLRRALSFAPDSSAANFSLGLLLIRARDYAQALPHLQRATEQPDSAPQMAYVYAVALDSMGRTDQALTFLTRAVAIWPEQTNLLWAQVSYMEKLGSVVEIQIPLKKLQALLPGSKEVGARLQHYSRVQQ